METPMTRKDALKLGAAAGVAFSATGLLPRAAKAAPVGVGSKPSILLIVVDDMPDRLLEVMETVQEKLIEPGTRFLNAYTAIPLCGPNRAAILSGMFPHTTKVTTNSAWQAFAGGGHEAFTFVKALNDAGYDTALFGKYMNGRGGSTSIPPGWDRWFELPGSSTHSSTGYVVNDQGKNVSYPNSKNDSQLAYEKALPWIKSRTPATTPFFIKYSPTNPHNPYTPTAAHAHDYDNVRPRNVPSINEADVSDKPAKMRKGMVSVSTMENAEEGMREELEDTDDFIADLIDAAEAVTGNSNLLIIFTSDNGFQTGEHRLMNKSWPYQESIEIPLIMRATGLPAQQEPTQLVSSVDISATILNFAGVAPPRAFDGRSLHEIVLGSPPTSWRKRVLIENPNVKYWQMYREFEPDAGKDFAFIRHLNDPTPEFYDLNPNMDPYQLNSTPSKITADMRSKLDRLTRLTGANLRVVEEEASTTPGDDTTSPKVTSTSPKHTATAVAPSSNLTATFSEKMDPASITNSTFQLLMVNPDGSTTQVTDVMVSLSPDGLVATLDPFGSSQTLLSSNTKYKAVITTEAKDVAGNLLDQHPTTSGFSQKTWTFTTNN